MTKWETITITRKGLFSRKDFSLDVIAYSDAAFAMSIYDRKFITGYCVFVSGNILSWRNKKQTVTKSSVESK